MRAAAVRILRTLRTALGRWLALHYQGAEVARGKANRRASAKPRARGAKRGDRNAAGSKTERKRTSWFSCDPETLHAAQPRDPDEEEAEAWDRAHFRNGRR
jgi:hypothetical protein